MNISNKVINTSFALLGGAGIGAAIAVMLCYSENFGFTLLFALTFAVGGLFYLTRFVMDEFVNPYLGRKRAAKQALGKEGIRVLSSDKTAKTAYRGILALFSAKFPKAEELLHEALAMADVRQNQMFCIEWLIKLYETMENDGKLMWCFRKSVEYAPDNPEAQSRLGHAYFSAGKLDQAMYCFEQALRYDPNNGYSYFSMAKIQMLRGEDEKAFDTLQKLLKINENHPLVHAELADYYAMQGNAELAEEECKKSQLCGIQDPEDLSRRIKAILGFSNAEYSEKDLPAMFYRRIEKPAENGGA